MGQATAHKLPRVLDRGLHNRGGLRDVGCIRNVSGSIGRPEAIDSMSSLHFPESGWNSRVLLSGFKLVIFTKLVLLYSSPRTHSAPLTTVEL